MLLIGKKAGEGAKEEEPEEVKRAKKEVAAKRAKFPGLCIPDNPDDTEVRVCVAECVTVSLIFRSCWLILKI